MNKKLLIGLIAGLGIILTIFNPVLMGILSIAFWIYLGMLIWKRKPIFQDKMESELAKKRLNSLKVVLVLAGILCLVSIGGILLHNIRSGLAGTEESLYFFIAIIATYLFILVSACGLVIFLKGRQKPM